MPANEEDLPGTLQRSPKKAQETYRKTLDSAHETYEGDEEAAHRAAYASLKHSFHKVGDHWEPKDEKGPSDPQAAESGQEAIEGRHETGGGKDIGASKDELYEKARELQVSGRSKMDKDELAKAVRKAQD